MPSTASYGSFSARSASSSSARSTSVSARLGSSCRHSAAARCCSRSCRSRFKCPPAPYEGSCCFTTTWSSEGSATRLRCMWSVPNRADPGVNRGRRRRRSELWRRAGYRVHQASSAHLHPGRRRASSARRGSRCAAAGAAVPLTRSSHAPGRFCLAESATPNPAASMGSTCDADQTDPFSVLIAMGLSADHTLAIRRPQPKLVNIGHELGTTSGVINVSRARFAALKSGVTRHFGRSRPDDHEIRITSLVILVIWLFE